MDGIGRGPDRTSHDAHELRRRGAQDHPPLGGGRRGSSRLWGLRLLRARLREVVDAYGAVYYRCP